MLVIGLMWDPHYVITESRVAYDCNAAASGVARSKVLVGSKNIKFLDNLFSGGFYFQFGQFLHKIFG